MTSRWKSDTTPGDRLADAERLLGSHHYARPVVREIGSQPTPIRPAAAPPKWPARLGILPSVGGASFAGEPAGVAVSAAVAVAAAVDW